MKTFLHALAAPFRALADPEGRRAWALMLLCGAGISMTAFASVGLYMLRDRPTYVFYLAAGAMLLIGIVITGYAGLLVKRDIDINALGMKFRVSDQEVQAIAAAVVAATPPPPPAPPAAAGPAVIVQTGAQTP